MAFKGIVFGDSTVGRKGAAQGGDTLDMAPELDLVGEEGFAGLAVCEALVGKVRFILCGEFCCGDEDVVGHSVLLDEPRHASAHSYNAEAPAVTDLQHGHRSGMVSIVSVYRSR
jgi:hypothetical protein